MENPVAKAFVEDYLARAKEGVKEVWINFKVEEEEKKNGSK